MEMVKRKSQEYNQQEDNSFLSFFLSSFWLLCAFHEYCSVFSKLFLTYQKKKKKEEEDNKTGEVKRSNWNFPSSVLC